MSYFAGIDPLSCKMEWEDAPCSCGLIHKIGDDTYERFDLLLAHIDGQTIYKNTTRCKVCKEATIERRKI